MTMTNEVLGLGRKICGTFGKTLAEVDYPEVVRVLHRGISYLERLRTCAQEIASIGIKMGPSELDVPRRGK